MPSDQSTQQILEEYKKKQEALIGKLRELVIKVHNTADEAEYQATVKKLNNQL